MQRAPSAGSSSASARRAAADRTEFVPAAPAARARRHGPETRRRQRAIWISDVHLGTRACRADLLLDFLARHECEHLYLVGDIVDGWHLRRKWYWNEDQNRVVREILAKSADGTRVHYVCGNHDEFLREYAGLEFGGVRLVDEAEHRCLDGRRLLVLHGDRFDVQTRGARWLELLGEQAYRVCLALNAALNGTRRLFGWPYWSLATWLKSRVQRAVDYIGRYERAVVGEARRRGFDGVVCGHIHHAAARAIDGVLYLNDGDWVESCTALVERLDGALEVVRWPQAGAERTAPRRSARQAVGAA